jgi:outer membrane protein assembly factor BamB
MRNYRLLFSFTFVMASACAGALDLGSRPDAGPSDDGGQDAPDSGSTPEVGPDARCFDHCTSTKLAIIANASGLACTSGIVYVGTTDGKLFAVDRTSGSSSEILPRTSAAIGYLAYSKGRLFYTLPSAGEVRSRSLRDGTDVRLAAAVSEPRGVAVNEYGDVWVATAVGVAQVTPGIVDQTLTAVVTFATKNGPGVGLALAGTPFRPTFLVTHPTKHSTALYAESGRELTSQDNMSGVPLVGVATSKTTAYYAATDGTIWASETPPQLGLPLAVDQFLPSGVCFASGRVYFITESDIRFVDAE